MEVLITFTASSIDSQRIKKTREKGKKKKNQVNITITQCLGAHIRINGSTKSSQDAPEGSRSTKTAVMALETGAREIDKGIQYQNRSKRQNMNQSSVAMLGYLGQKADLEMQAARGTNKGR